MSEWTKSQEDTFKRDSVIEEVLANPIQRQRVDLAVEYMGKDRHILDVGAGDGAISELFYKNSNTVVAMDLPEVLATVPEERKSWLKLVEWDASKKPWPFQDGEFDGMFMGEIIEHFIDLEPPMSEARRVLKPGGRLILTTPNATRWLNRIAMLIGVVHTWHEWQKIPHHIRYFTPISIQEALTKYGFHTDLVAGSQSQAEGESEWGFNESWIQGFSPEERRVLRRLLERFTQYPAWKHSFIIIRAAKAE